MQPSVPVRGRIAPVVFATLKMASSRPAHVLYINTYGSEGAIDSISIGTNGVMTVFNSRGDNFTSLAAISFPAAPVIGHKLALWFPTYTNDGAFGWVMISPKGAISAANFFGSNAAQLLTSLATITYPVSS